MGEGPHFVDDRHALYTGWVLGLASKHGLKPVPLLDAESNYTPRFTVELPGAQPPLYAPARITLAVPPPDDDWQP